MPFSNLQSTGDVAEDVRTFLMREGKTGTVKHISEVVAEARRLAEHYGADVEAAAVAAWCHDLATVVPRDAWIAQAEKWGAAITSSDRVIQMLLHGPIAAEVAQQIFGITDEGILNAIRHHSTLRAGASQIETIVFTADKIALDPTSPVSDFVPVIKHAFADGAPLEKLAFIYLDWVVKNGPGLGWTVHERVQAAWEDLNQQGFGA